MAGCSYHNSWPLKSLGLKGRGSKMSPMQFDWKVLQIRGGGMKGKRPEKFGKACFSQGNFWSGMARVRLADLNGPLH